MTEVITVINFEEELKNFKPSLEVEEAEQAIYNHELTDMTDVLQEILYEAKRHVEAGRVRIDKVRFSMECYNCGAKLGKGDICQNCGANVKIYKKIIMASNAYYNDALEKAAVRDLSGAIESLRTSLRFYKMNIDARNLLGLVYFETGEVVEALTEWVISKNYQPRDNAASRYLNEIQNNPSRLDTINQTIKNTTRRCCTGRQDSRDLAIIQLKKVLSLNPKLVSGHQLLALLYIQEKKYDLAKKSLRNAGKIDANNTTTLRYLKEVNAGLRENNPKKQKNEDLISYQSGNETIIQPRYLKDNSAI